MSALVRLLLVALICVGADLHGAVDRGLLAGRSDSLVLDAPADPALEPSESLADDGLSVGPNLYAYVKQNPWTSFDPHGLNEVIVSGGINTDLKSDPSHDNNWKNFVKAADLEMGKREKLLHKGEKLEWFVQRSSYVERGGDDYLAQIKGMAEKHGATLRYFESAKDLMKQSQVEAETGNTRSGDSLVSRFTFFGHGIPGKLWTKFGGGTGHEITIDDLKGGGFSRSAFAPGATAESWACNSATLTTGGSGPSFAQAWKSATGVPMGGLVGKADYGPTAEPGVKETMLHSIAVAGYPSAMGTFPQMTMPTIKIREPSGPKPGKQVDGSPSQWVEP